MTALMTCIGRVRDKGVRAVADDHLCYVLIICAAGGNRILSNCAKSARCSCGSGSSWSSVSGHHPYAATLYACCFVICFHLAALCISATLTQSLYARRGRYLAVRCRLVSNSDVTTVYRRDPTAKLQPASLAPGTPGILKVHSLAQRLPDLRLQHNDLVSPASIHANLSDRRHCPLLGVMMCLGHRWPMAGMGASVRRRPMLTALPPAAPSLQCRVLIPP